MLLFFIHFRARKRGIAPLSASELPNIRDTIREGWHFAIPIVVLVGTLIYGFTPTFAAATGTASIVVTSWLNKNTRMNIRDIVDALALGAHNMIITGIILLCAGIIVGVVLMVGVGIKFSLLISAIAGSSVLVTVVLIAIASLILGMGLPVTASYIVLAVLAAPALTNLGGESDCGAFADFLVFTGCQCHAAGLSGCVFRRRYCGGKSAAYGV